VGERRAARRSFPEKRERVKYSCRKASTYEQEDCGPKINQPGGGGALSGLNGVMQGSMAKEESSRTPGEKPVGPTRPAGGCTILKRTHDVKRRGDAGDWLLT